MKILVTGVTGQLGHDVAELLSYKGHDVLAPSHGGLDIVDGYAVSKFFENYEPEAVIHCAAYTAVDKAEDEPELCRMVNVDGTRNLVECCEHLDIPIVYISTDYVFDGSGVEPWTIDSPISPINVYGRSKADGEAVVKRWYKHFIVRISWVFGINGKNFVKTMLNYSNKTDVVRVVADQFGSPTFTLDIAPLLCDMIVSDKYGTYHAHNRGICTWFEFAVEIFKLADINMTVIPISSCEYVVKAKRPLNSRLDCSSLSDSGFKQLPDWTDALSRYLLELRNGGHIR